MTEIIRSQDCGNSPKNQLVENLSIALLTNELKNQSDLVTEDVKWNKVGGKSLHGREVILNELDTISGHSILKLIVVHAITHGKSGAVNGEVQYESSTEGFCFVFEFANAKGKSVRQITSYHIAM